MSRIMTYSERAELLGSIASVLSENKEKYYRTARENSGNTKTDAFIDIDGGIGTLIYFSRLGSKLEHGRYLVEAGFDRLGKDENFQSAHIWTPIQGVAIHINAFNFPSWGLWEKAAVALLSGVAVFAKPATATSLLSYQMVRDLTEADILPAGALSLICGGGRELMDLVTGADAIAFTGSADTAAMLRANANVISSNVRFNVEADSLNVSMLGPDVTTDSPEFTLFIKEVAREMTVKAGQKCTAIRRALVPDNLINAVCEALEARLSRVVTGDPQNEEVSMGPLVNKAQQRAALEGLAALKAEAQVVVGDNDFTPVDADADTGCFVPPTLLRCDAPNEAKAVHDIEVFGPVSTLMPYGDKTEGFHLAARGLGSLAGSVFTGDDDFAAEAALALGPSHGRVLIVNEAIGKSQTGHGIVMPQCVHGGPGRAGGGEELGGTRGLRFYHQRSALQADLGRLIKIKEQGATVTFS